VKRAQIISQPCHYGGNKIVP